MSAIKKETDRAVGLVGRDKVIPIIQLDDDELTEAQRACESAAGVNFFVWKKDYMSEALSQKSF